MGQSAEANLYETGTFGELFDRDLPKAHPRTRSIWTHADCSLDERISSIYMQSPFLPRSNICTLMLLFSLPPCTVPLCTSKFQDIWAPTEMVVATIDLAIDLG